MSRLKLDKLVSLYGRIPSFHDSRVLSIQIREDRIAAQFYLNELAANLPKQEWDHCLHVITTLEWHGLKEFSLALEQNILYMLEFVPTADGVTTLWYRLYTEEVAGRTVADSVSVKEACWAEDRFSGLNGEDIEVLRVSYERDSSHISSDDRSRLDPGRGL